MSDAPKTYSTLVIPNECVPFLRMQRSRYGAAKVPDDEVAKERYGAHVLEDYENMKPHLPAGVKTILEIGCGIGALSVHLKRHYPEAALHLLDADTVTRDGGAGYSNKPDQYNSRAVTELMLSANGFTVDKWYNIGHKGLLEADLIVSLASWGFHYPLSTYRAKGLAIVDLRRGVEKPRGTIIFNGIKNDRHLFVMDDK